MRSRTAIVLVFVAVAGIAMWVWRAEFFEITRTVSRKTPLGHATLAQRLAQIGPAATARLAPDFKRAGVPYPPAEVRFVGLKDRRQFLVFAKGPETSWRLVRTHPVLAASGGTGPKLAEGDLQVPEGEYRVSFLNPNSRFHVSLRLDYPNAFDRAMAARDGRSKLGGDIMIHGSSVSVGCLAMGDEVAEDLFVLAAATGIEHIRVILAPTDLRLSTPVPGRSGPAWQGDLYTRIRHALSALPQD